MKTMLKIIGFVLLAAVVLVVLALWKAAVTPMAPKDYTETVSTGGALEGTYLKNGSSAVGYFEQKTDAAFEAYEVWYPKELEGADRRFPVLVVLNGTGVKASKYKAQFEHFASWGFVAIGTEEAESWNAVAADSSLAFLLAENERPGSLFYQKIDVDNVGAVGHSQGGAGVFRAVTEMEHSALYKTAVSLSPTHEEMARALGWSYDLTKVSVPTLMLAGTKGEFEMEMVIPEEAMTAMYEKLAVPKAMARKRDMEHGEMLYSADGYSTAWFLWQLQGDEEAAEAFIGKRPELLENPLYQNQRTDLA